jgi:hypothetical protein
MYFFYNLSNRSLYNLKNLDNDLNEVINKCPTNDITLSGNSKYNISKKRLN